jgi:hypothetical protein
MTSMAPTSPAISSLDLDGALRLFLSVKHTRLEGLVIEYEFEQTFIRSLAQEGWKFLDALILQRMGRRTYEQEFLILDRGAAASSEVRRLLAPTKIPVREIALEKDDVLLLDDANGRRMPQPQKIGRNGALPETAPDAIDDRRVKAMFWGFASHLGERFVRLGQELLLKDLYVGPGHYLWDVDRLCISPSGQPFLIETKHKYPMVRGTALSFGLNTGEFRQFRTFANAGLQIAHVVLVKPRWDKGVSSMYLFFDRAARERALWLAADLTQFARSDASKSSADASTSLYGRQSVDFVNLPLNLFSIVGANALSIRQLSASLRDFLAGVRREEIEPSRLLSLRLG